MSSTSSVTPDCGGRYARPRMACLAGYYDPPSIFTAMSFDLRQLPLVLSRIVILGTRKLELWTPNSLQYPFLPGAFQSNYRPTAAATLIAERRYDGHYGKHDCLHAPQYFRADAMHWPFIRRASAVSSEDGAYDAFAPLTSFWTPDSKRNPSPRGFLQPDFIARLGDLERSLEARMLRFRRRVDSREWDRRPSAKMGSATGRLLSIRTWDEAVDQGVAIQRSLREMEAWVSWEEEIERQRALSQEDMRNMDMMLAQEEFIGVWVNGADERTTLFYMAAGVPCFIVHEYAPGATSRDEVRDVRVFKDLVSGTELETELSEDNPYQRLARLQSFKDTPFSGEDGRGRARLATAADEARSSSLHLESLRRPMLIHPHRLGYSRPNLLPSRAPSMAAEALNFPPSRAPSMAAEALNPPEYHRGSPAPSRALPRAAETSGHKLPGVAPAARKAGEDRYTPRPVERVTIATDREDWIVPPPIHSDWTGQWTRWELSIWAGVPAWVSRGKKAEIDAEAVWYDRELGRRLYIDDFVPSGGSLDFQKYGAPVPRFPFYFDNGGSGVAHRASSWMYPTQGAAKHEVGRRQSRPDARRLPLKKGKKPTSDGPDAGGAMSKGKGKAREGEYMEVDDEEGRASNVIALRGVDSQVTALMFRAFAADALYAVRAAPPAIVHGQGRMWLRFESTSEARRAFGALVEMNSEVEGAFEPDGAFDEAFTYSRDRWTIATMRGEEFPEEMDVDSVSPAVVERPAAAPVTTAPVPFQRFEVAPLAPPVSAASHATRLVPASTDLSAGSSSSTLVVERSLAAPTPQIVERSLAAPILPAPTPSIVERSLAAPTLPAATPPIVEPLIAAPTPPAPSLGNPRGARPFLPSRPPTIERMPPSAPRSMRATTNAFRRLSLAERLEPPPPYSPIASSSRSAPVAFRSSRPSLAESLSNPPTPLAQRLSDAPYPSYPRYKKIRADGSGDEQGSASDAADDMDVEESEDLEPGEIEEDDDMDAGEAS
ncbi:hypothetical protein B0H15DRAFT_806923 [Mycena belliarum]|uniref:Uncharacterized protein n=1 Tax=Mycena belliarum TaxID=1033014 RepID=A0AAD6XIE3_9AGAR|nr:hypothetical protein B0H15DRAFT_806923 [Mycena belliae]